MLQVCLSNEHGNEVKRRSAEKTRATIIVALDFYCNDVLVYIHGGAKTSVLTTVSRKSAS